MAGETVEAKRGSEEREREKNSKSGYQERERESEQIATLRLGGSVDSAAIHRASLAQRGA